MAAEKTNLLEETLAALKSYGLKPADVEWVGSSDGRYAIEWDEFAAIANVEYNDGWGMAEIARDLVIVGADWWLDRYE